MASFAEIGSSMDQAVNSAKEAQRREEYNAERAMREAQNYYEMSSIRENMNDNSELINHLMGELADMRWTIQELRGEIDSIKMQMNMPASMGGYAPTGAPNTGLPTPPRQANPLADWYVAGLDAEGTGI